MPSTQAKPLGPFLGMIEKKRPAFFYGWLIVTISALAVAIVYGIRYSFSVFYVSILDEFGWSRADTALIFSINVIVYGLSAPIFGILVDRFGPRKVMTSGVLLVAIATAACSLANQIWQFYVLFGLLASLGICASGYVPNSAVVSRWFVRRRGAALGIFAVGWALAYIMSYGVESLISWLEWRRSFIALSFLALAIAPAIAIFMRFDPKEKGLLPDGEAQGIENKKTDPLTADSLVLDKKWVSEQWTLRKAVKTHRFWFIFLGNLMMWGLGVGLILAHQVAFAVDEGYSRAFGALIFSLYGTVYAGGNLLGFLSDRLGREMAITIGLAFGVVGVFMLTLNQGNTTPWFMYAYSVFFGLGMGFVSPAFIASAADIFQGRNFATITGLIVMGFGIGGSISPWLGGKIFDIRGDYLPAFYFVMVALALSAACFWIAGPRQVRMVPGKARAALNRKNREAERARK
ncbi:MAG: MFS transporter [Chloroflexi bacterium]|nr:MFS transporter [Chloroflexota bacterium]